LSLDDLELDDRKIYFNRWKGLLFALGAAIFTYGSWQVYNHKIGDPSSNSLRYWIGGLGGLIFFGLATLVIVTKILFGPSVLYLISKNGVHIYGRYLGIDIPWSAVSGISGKNIGRQKYLVLEVNNENLAKLRGSSLTKWFRKGNRGILINFSLATTNMDTGEFIARRHYENWLLRNQ
jgi:hypothetical protein